MTLQELESRVVELEKQLAELRAQAHPQTKRKPRCVEDTFGMFDNDPDFDEIIRLGREYRQQTFEED